MKNACVKCSLLLGDFLSEESLGVRLGEPTSHHVGVTVNSIARKYCGGINIFRKCYDQTYLGNVIAAREFDCSHYHSS